MSVTTKSRTPRRVAATLGLGAALATTSLLAATSPANAAQGTARIGANATSVRTAPTTASRIEYTLRAGQNIPVQCWVHGQPVKGNDRWYKYIVEGMPALWVNGSTLAAQPKNVGECIANTYSTGRATTAIVQRQAPHTTSAARGSLRAGATFSIMCKIQNQSVGGNNIWYYTTNGTWVAAKYVANVGAAPVWCNQTR